MIVKSPKKKEEPVNITVESSNGAKYALEKKSKIKYLGVLLDETVSFKHHISYVCTRTSRNNAQDFVEAETLPHTSTNETIVL